MAATVQVSFDKRRTLRFDLNTMVLFERESGVTFTSAFATDNVSFSALRTFLWAGLVHEDSGLTLEDVGSIVESAPGEGYGEKLKYCFDCVAKVMQLGSPSDDQGGPKKKESLGTGDELEK